MGPIYYINRRYGGIKMSSSEADKETQRLADKKFEDFIQGLYDPDHEAPNEDRLDNFASSMLPKKERQRKGIR